MYHLDYAQKKTLAKRKGGKLSFLGLRLFGLFFMFGFFSLVFSDSFLGPAFAIIGFLCLISSAPVMCIGSIIEIKKNPQYQAQDIDQVRYMGILGLVGGIGFLFLSLYISYFISSITKISLILIVIFLISYTYSMAISFICLSIASFHYYTMFKKQLLEEEKRNNYPLEA